MAKQADPFPITSRPVELPAEERERIEDEIESHLDAAGRLIEALDQADGDPELCGSEHDGREPDTDFEPSIGWPEFMNQARALKTCTGSAAANSLEQDNADNEPSLGWSVGGAHGITDDREQDCEDEGADADVLECEPWAIFQ